MRVFKLIQPPKSSRRRYKPQSTLFLFLQRNKFCLLLPSLLRLSFAIPFLLPSPSLSSSSSFFPPPMGGKKNVPRGTTGAKICVRVLAVVFRLLFPAARRLLGLSPAFRALGIILLWPLALVIAQISRIHVDFPRMEFSPLVPVSMHA